MRDQSTVDVFRVCWQTAGKITAVGACQRHGLVEGLALNHLAPFHIVEEEGLGPIRVVQLPKRYRTADVKTKDVVSKFSNMAEEQD